MLVNIHHDTPAEHRRLLVSGVAFLVSIALLIWLSIAIYNKTFVSVTTIKVDASRAVCSCPSSVTCACMGRSSVRSAASRSPTDMR